MKKFILALVLVVMVGMDAGVAWGVGINDALKDQGGDVGASDKKMDDAFSGDGSFDQDVIDASEPCPDGQVYNSFGNCVAEVCGKEEFYSKEEEECVSWELYCDDQGGLEYDPVIGNCYVPGTSQSTLLPGTRFVETECEQLFTHAASELNLLQDIMTNDDEPFELTIYNKDGTTSEDRFFYPLDVLGCAIKTGRVSMWMIPFFVKYLIQFAISIAGLVAVGAIIIGGYFYLFSGLDNDKERGKKAIMYGLLGFIVVLLAWTIVNAAIGLLTR